MCVVQMPKPVNNKAPITCNAATASAAPQRCANNKPITSAEKVENVVNPPKNPVIKVKRHKADHSG